MTTELLRSHRDIYELCNTVLTELGSRDSSVTIVTRPRAGQLRNRGSIPSGGKTSFFSPVHRDRLWGPPIRPYEGYHIVFHWE